MPQGCGALNLPQFPWLVAGRFSAAKVIRSQTEGSSDSQFVNYELDGNSACKNVPDSPGRVEAVNRVYAKQARCGQGPKTGRNRPKPRTDPVVKNPVVPVCSPR